MFKKFIYTLCIFAVSVNALSQEIEGNWLGTLNIMGNKLRVGFNIEKLDSLFVSTMDSPDQGAFGLPTTKTSFINNKLEITASQLGIQYQGILEEDSISGTFTQAGVSFPLVLRKTEKPAAPNRPQTPQAPFPYKTEEVTIENSLDSVTLSGTLTLPESEDQSAAVILIAGSGRNDRDETILGHKPFLVLADHLTRNGIAVLRYDKRGVGESTGYYSRATTFDFANDVKVLLEYLANRPEINPAKIGLIGHSEGGIIAPIVAAETDDKVAFIVSMAGTGTKGLDIILYQNEVAMRQQNMEPENIDEMQALNREIFESLKDWENTENNRTELRDKLTFMWNKTPLLIQMKMNKEQFIHTNFNTLISPWYREFLHLDPTQYLNQVRCPVLILNGEKDTQVPAPENPEAIKKALEEGGNYRSEMKIYPLLNHLFQESETGLANEYTTIEQTLSPELLEDITTWINRITSQKE